MSKKSKKRRRKKLSSSSSDEDERVKTSKHHHKSKMKKDAARETRHRDHHSSHRVKDGSHSTRQNKKPVYRLSTTEATGHRSVHKEEEHAKRKHVTAPLKGDNCHSKERTTTVSKSNNVEKGPSQPLKSAAGVCLGSKKRTSERSFDERSSQKCPVKLKTQLSPSLISGEQKEHRRNERKRKHQHEEVAKTAKYLSPLKTSESSKSLAVSKDSLSDKRKELVKEKEQRRYLEKDKMDKKTPPCTETSAVAKCTTSEFSSVVSKTFTSVPESITVLSHQAGKPSFTLHKICSNIMPVKSEVKSPKMDNSKPGDITAKGSGDEKKHETEHSSAGTSQKNVKHDTVQRSTYHVDVFPHVNPFKITKINKWKPVGIAAKDSGDEKKDETELSYAGTSQKSVKHDTVQRSSYHVDVFPHLKTFKIPKINKWKPADIAAKDSGDEKKNETELSYAGTSQKNVKHDTGQHSPYHVDVSPHLNKFKIPKINKWKPVDIIRKDSGDEKKDETELSYAGTSQNSFKHSAVQNSPYHVDIPPPLNPPNQDKMTCLAQQPPVVCDPGPSAQHNQKMVVEELHLARSEKRLEVDVMQSYGELTSMDIDPPEEGATDTQWKQQLQQNLILVMDTNILLSHLNYVKKIISHGCGALGFPVVLIPWVVLQELDSLKKNRGLSGSVAHLAVPAISYIYNSVKNREPHIWGQSMQQATHDGLSAENNDDRVLQCCLQYQSLYPECALILCTDDKNLCSKALLSGVKAFRKDDLEAEVVRSSHGFPSLQINQIPMIPHTSPITLSPAPGRSCPTVEPLGEERAGLSVGKDNMPLCREEKEDVRDSNLSCRFSELENCLKVALSDVLEVEMKAAFDNLWLDVVHIKPPWSLLDVLRCMKKHWIAVFGQISPRKNEKTVENLIDFFDSGRKLELDATIEALQESKELLKAFVKSSSCVPSAISVVENIFHNLQTQGESPVSDVVMHDDDEDKQPTCTQVSPQEVWALFETIWSNVCQISLKVFKALGFDPHNMQTVQPVGGPPPPQDALACLQKLCCMVSQLLQAFSSILSSDPGLEEVQTLLSVIQTSEIVDVDKLTAKDLFECFSQQEYRVKLSFGGTQLMEIKDALDRCVAFTHRLPFS